MSENIIPLPFGFEIRSERFQYTIKQVIGNGSNGIVYLAEMFSIENRTSCNVALKEWFPEDCCKRLLDMSVSILYNSYLGVELSNHRFREEYDVLSEINHKNVVTVYDFVSTNGTCYYSMECLLGGTLLDYINSKTHYDIERCIFITKQLASGIKAFHQKGYIHSDLQLKNIVFRNDSSVVLIDGGVHKEDLDSFEKSRDIWSLANVLLSLLSGGYYAPSIITKKTSAGWQKEIFDNTQAERLFTMAKEKSRITDNIEKVIRMAFNAKFRTVNDFINALDGKYETYTEKGQRLRGESTMRKNNDPKKVKVFLGEMERVQDCYISKEPICLRVKGNYVNTISSWFKNIQKEFVLGLRLPSPDEFIQYVETHRIGTGEYMTFDFERAQFYKANVKKKGFAWHQTFIVINEVNIFSNFDKCKFYFACDRYAVFADSHRFYRDLNDQSKYMTADFDVIRPISLFGLCKVLRDGKWGMLNILGEISMELECQYDDIKDISFVSIPGPGPLCAHDTFIGTTAYSGDKIDFYRLTGKGRLYLECSLSTSEYRHRSMLS